MNIIDNAIITIDKIICTNIDQLSFAGRGFLAQNIMSQLRNFVEHISLKIHSHRENMDIDSSYDSICNANEYIKTIWQLNFLSKFHKSLQISASHYTENEENSERLMLKYYEYLIRIKKYLKEKYAFDVLSNIDQFPIDTDLDTIEYYTKIAEKVNKVKSKDSQSERYYIQKIKPFFINNEIYYEVTFTRANDYTSRFDRIIAFTKLDIPDNYAVKLYINNNNIDILNKKMPIRIIYNREVAIRPCEINNFSYILWKNLDIKSENTEYKNLMFILTKTWLNLVELVSFSEDYYQRIKSKISGNAKSNNLINILNECRNIIAKKTWGHNVIRYLLYKLNNKIIKQQRWNIKNEKLSNLHLKFGCIPFDKMPLNTSLINHNPKLSDLFNCINSEGKEHELFARFIKNNIEINGHLYTPISDVANFGNIEDLIQTYNNKLYYTHSNRKLETYKKHISIQGYENDVINIIQELKKLLNTWIKNYSNSVENWLQQDDNKPDNIIDCDDKKNFLKKLFEKSNIAVIYWAAGTWKSTMIKHISNFFKEKEKIFLTNTNPAIDNLKRKINTSNCSFKTITKFLATSNHNKSCDLLIIDECSTVSNNDMFNILQKASFKLLVLVWDPFQIESIQFGNWFNIVKEFIPATSIFELTKPYRSENEDLLDLRWRVRNMKENILEKITKNNYSTRLDESIFQQSDNDQIILCLNYDGLYWINNINRFLQWNNINPPIQWWVHIYKINDPIIFNETDRFGSSIYNNLKWKIIDITKLEDQIQFDIEIDKVLNEFDEKNFELIGNSENGKSIIRFLVNKNKNVDDDDDDSSDTIVPFQVAYAISIHKSQWLEYDFVKIVITNEIEEKITHNIFYTAITRAKKNLKIYRSPETEKHILKKIEKKDNEKDTFLLKSKYNL